MNKIVIETIDELLDIKVSEYSLTSSFEDLGIDILDLSEIIMILEDKMEITADDSIYDARTVGELGKHINKLIKN